MSSGRRRRSFEVPVGMEINMYACAARRKISGAAIANRHFRREVDPHFATTFPDWGRRRNIRGCLRNA